MNRPFTINYREEMVDINMAMAVNLALSFDLNEHSEQFSQVFSSLHAPYFPSVCAHVYLFICPHPCDW